MPNENQVEKILDKYQDQADNQTIDADELLTRIREDIRDMPNKQITIPFTERDLQDLQNGEVFDWTFPTEDNQSIDVHLRLEEPEDLE